jgi:hypothetical protein
MAYKYTKIKAGINESDTLKAEKAQAVTAAWELLCCKDQKTREMYRTKIIGANSTSEISSYLKEVRDLI